MSGDDEATSASPGDRRHQYTTRRGLLSIPPIVAAAFLLPGTPAQANSRTVECLADLGEF